MQRLSKVLESLRVWRAKPRLHLNAVDVEAVRRERDLTARLRRLEVRVAARQRKGDA